MRTKAVKIDIKYQIAFQQMTQQGNQISIKILQVKWNQKPGERRDDEITS